MSQTTATNQSPLFLERVREIAEKGLEGKTGIWGRIDKKDPQDINVRDYFLPFLPDENESEEWHGSESFDYAPAGEDNPIRMQVSYTRVSATCSFSKDVKQMDRQGSAIIKIVGDKIARKTARLKKRLNQYACSDGSGEMGRVSTIASNVITFATTGNLYGSTKFGKGQRIQFWNPALSSQRVGGGVSISTVSSAPDTANKTVTFDQVPSDISTATTGDVATVKGAANNVLRGVQYHANNSGTYQTQSRSTYPSLNAVVLSASSAALSVSLLSRVYHTMIFRLNDSAESGLMNNDGYIWVFPPEQVAQYEALGIELQVMNMPQEKLDLGFTGYAFKGNPIFQEVDYTPTEVGLFNFSKLDRVQLKALAPEVFPGGDIFWPMNASSGTGHKDGDNVYLTGKMQTFSANPKEFGSRLTTLDAGSVNRHAA
jgi:hypothetical protein